MCPARRSTSTGEMFSFSITVKFCNTNNEMKEIITRMYTYLLISKFCKILIDSITIFLHGFKILKYKNAIKNFKNEIIKMV